MRLSREPLLLGEILINVWLGSSGLLSAQETHFRRGDYDQDGTLDQTDCIDTLFHLFLGEPPPACLDAADSNDDGAIDISDPIYGLTFLYLGGQSIPAPGHLKCGIDPTADGLGCDSYQASCLTAGSCRAGGDCPGDFYCFYPEGDCGELGREGECRERPLGCPEIFDPVCGCDGRTYGNACEAAAAGANVRFRGPCEPAGDCKDNANCPEKLYCAKQAGDCGGLGICDTRPEICPDLFKPVCGCDGVTYGNACEAAASGASVAYEGECLPEGDCDTSADCPDGFYCARPVGECDRLGRKGTCAPMPAGCPKILDPVCGCDGATYGNECEAQRAGVNVAYRGECKPPGGCTDNAECPPLGSYCAKAEGDCDGAGSCQVRPFACLAIYDPVCGCDGQTYSNDCYAAAAGVNVRYRGECIREN